MAIVGPDVPYQDSGRSISTPGGANASSCGVAGCRPHGQARSLPDFVQGEPAATRPSAGAKGDQKISGMKVWSDIGGRT